MTRTSSKEKFERVEINSKSACIRIVVSNIFKLHLAINLLEFGKY